MPLVPWALLGLLASLASAHPGHKAPEGHFHVYAAPAPGSSAQTVDMGACVGERPSAPPPAGGPLFDASSTPIDKEEREYWALFGWTIQGHRLLRADGSPATAAEVAYKRAPFDAASERINSDIWVSLYDSGHRLDEASCRIIDDLGKPAARLYVEAVGLIHRKYNERLAIESFKAAMAGLKPGDPVPPSVLQRIEAMKTQAVKLPRALGNAVASASTVGEALASVDAAHAEAARFWDGQTTLSDRLRAALPLVPGVTGPQRGRAYVNSSEFSLGAALQKDLVRVLERYEPGKELVARFRRPDGKLELPAIQVAKLSQRPDDEGGGLAGAIFNPYTNAIVFNHWGLAKQALALAPQADRPRLAKEFAEPLKLSAWLIAHPAQRQALLEKVDLILHHELVHAWQHRRSRFDLEMLRDNLPAVNPLEKEHEAYREQYRYFHAKLVKEPEKYLDDREAASYAFLLSSYDDFRDNVTQLYMANFAGSSDLSTVRTMQRDRRALAERFASSSVGSRVMQALKLAGLGQGDRALDEFDADMHDRSKKFVSQEWPKMRAEGFAVMIAEHRRRGNLGQAYLLAWGSRGGVPQKETEALRSDLETRLAAGGGDLYDRVTGWEALAQAGVALGPVLQSRRITDYAEVTLAWLARSRHEKGTARWTALDWADFYVQRLSGKDRDRLMEEIRRERAR